MLKEPFVTAMHHFEMRPQKQDQFAGRLPTASAME
jgi:hypothetical protein